MNSKKQIIWFVLMIVMMAIILYFSNQPGEKSNNIGYAVAQTINIPPTNPWIDESHTQLLFGLNLRKWAYVGLFGALGLCTYGWLFSLPKATLVCLAYSVLDELHQIFVPGREARATDVLIDAAGFLVAILMFYIFGIIYKKVVRDKCEGRWTDSN